MKTKYQQCAIINGTPDNGEFFDWFDNDEQAAKSTRHQMESQDYTVDRVEVLNNVVTLHITIPKTITCDCGHTVEKFLSDGRAGYGYTVYGKTICLACKSHWEK